MFCGQFYSHLQLSQRIVLWLRKQSWNYLESTSPHSYHLGSAGSQWLTAAASGLNSSSSASGRAMCEAQFTPQIYPQDQVQARTSPETIPLVGFSLHIFCLSCALSNFPLNKPRSHKSFHIRICVVETQPRKPGQSHSRNSLGLRKKDVSPTLSSKMHLMLIPYWRFSQDAWQWSLLFFFSGRET